MNTSSPSLPVDTSPATAAAASRTRLVAIGLFVCAALVLVGVFTKSWFTPDRGEGGIGLTGVEVCHRGKCETASWSDLKRAPGDLAIFGWMGLLGGLASAGITAVAGGLLLSGRARQIPLKAMNVVLGLTAFATTLFAMRIFTEMSKGISISWSPFLAIGGLVAIGAIVKTSVQPLTKA